MMTDLILTTLKQVPNASIGYVRDLRVRWALEEAGLPYRVESVAFQDKTSGAFSQQPFGQVPWLTDGDITLFESGAILLHLAERSDVLMPTDARGRSEVIGWLFAALNSVEIVTSPWALFKRSEDTLETPGRKRLDALFNARLQQMENIFSLHEWLGRDFSVADILMADVLRSVNRFDGLAEYPASRAYVARATARPCFIKSYADQIAHFGAFPAAQSRT